jgi:hypothetical protein
MTVLLKNCGVASGFKDEKVLSTMVKKGGKQGVVIQRHLPNSVEWNNGANV